MTEPTSEVVASPNPVVPAITRASFANSTTRALAGAMTQQNSPLGVSRRWAIIDSINAVDDSVTILLSGELIEGIKYDANYTPIVGETVYLDIVGADTVVMGTMAPSLHNPGQRLGTVTSISADRETVNVTVDDGSLLTAVPVLSSYNPVINDQVHLSSYLGSFLVIGSLDRTAQTYRRAVGDIEPSLTVKPGTLALNGQVASRTTYPQLWAWVQANNLVAAGLFTAGDGTTTFGLPDFRGRVPVGAGTLGTDTYAVGTTGGSARSTLATAQMPSHAHSVSATTTAAGSHNHAGTSASGGSHDHTGTTAGDGSHSHGGSTSSNGAHDNHADGSTNKVSGADGLVAFGDMIMGAHTHTFTTDTAASHSHSFTSSIEPSHTHTFTTDTEAAHTHTVTVSESAVGGTTPVDLRQPFLGIHWVVWV